MKLALLFLAALTFVFFLSGCAGGAAAADQFNQEFKVKGTVGYVDPKTGATAGITITNRKPTAASDGKAVVQPVAN